MLITRNDMFTSRDISDNQGLFNEFSTAETHNVSTQSKSGASNGVLNFGIALGGILLVTIIVGVIAYMYRKRISCKQNISTMNSKISSGRISCIMDCYSNDYIPNTNNEYFLEKEGDKFDDPDSSITKDDVKDIVETNKSRSNTMKSNKSMASTLVAKINPMKSNNNSRSNTMKSSKSRNNTIKVVDEKDSHPQISISTSLISLPISMPSASIYDKDRARTLANTFSRPEAFQIQTTIPPTPPIPTHLLTNNKPPKELVRSKSDSDVNDVNSSGNLIPVIYVDSSTTTIVETIQPPNIDAKWFTNPVDYPAMSQYSSPVTSSATVTSATSVGVIPDWSKAPWQDGNNDNSNDDDDDDDDDDDESHYDRDRKSSIDLIRFSKSSRGSANKDTRSRLNQFSLFKDKPSPNIEILTQDQNNPTSESPSKSRQEDGTSFINKRLKEDIERDLEKYDFLKYDATAANKYKRKGNVFEYKLQRSKSVT